MSLVNFKEKDTVFRILIYFKKHNPQHQLFKYDWWILLLQKMAKTIEQGKNSERYKNISNVDKDTLLSNYILYSLRECDINLDIYGPYEYYPDYVDMNGTCVVNIMNRLEYMMNLFISK